jgi:hypothetical protein
MNIKSVISQYANGHGVICARDVSVDCTINIVTVRQYLSALFRTGNLE